MYVFIYCSLDLAIAYSSNILPLITGVNTLLQYAFALSYVTPFKLCVCVTKLVKARSISS